MAISSQLVLYILGLYVTCRLTGYRVKVLAFHSQYPEQQPELVGGSAGDRAERSRPLSASCKRQGVERTLQRLSLGVLVEVAVALDDMRAQRDDALEQPASWRRSPSWRPG
jgi:hypothetical protein